MAQVAAMLPEHVAPELFESEALYEVVNGQRRELQPMGAFEGVIASSLFYSLCRFAVENQLGWVVSEVLFLLDAKKGLQRRPDLAFVSYKRWPKSEIPSENAWNVIPNLAVEIVSPTNLSSEIEGKIVDYFESGVEHVWVVYPRTRRVYIYRSRAKCEIVELDGELNGDGVLTGLRLSLATLFDSVP